VRGIIFTQLSAMIEQEQGMAFYNRMLEEIQLPSGGVYTAGGNYDPAEIYSILAFLENALGIPQQFILRRFGEFLLKGLASLFPNFFEVESLKAFLLTIDRHIHVEVKKLYPDSELPTFQYLDEEDNRLTIYYNSSKKMCSLAEGLIEGSARYFNQDCSLLHTTCMHRGDDHCTLELEFYARS